MKFFNKRHEAVLYNTLLNLSRNIFFYKKLQLKDSFETRIYLMFFHYSIILLILKKKSIKYDQKSYDDLFNSIENNLRELGFGDVSVNKKMKDLNKIFYDENKAQVYFRTTFPVSSFLEKLSDDYNIMYNIEYM